MNACKLLFLFLFSIVCPKTFGQIQIPWPTTTSSSKTTVGLTVISLDYSRPSKNGREIFGKLVPYDTLWRTAANKNSLISFSDDVIVENRALKKGTYAIYTRPGRETWEVYFYTDTNNLGLPEKWDTSKVAARFQVKPETVSTTESFAITIDNIAYESCVLEIKWDNIRVPLKVEVPTDKIVSANIESVLNGPSSWDYYNAAEHYRRARKDLKQSLTWINTAIAKGSEDDFMFFYRKKSLIEAGLMDYAAAIKSANVSLDYAKAAKNNDYIKQNTESIKEWKAKQ